MNIGVIQFIFSLCMTMKWQMIEVYFVSFCLFAFVFLLSFLFFQVHFKSEKKTKTKQPTHSLRFCLQLAMDQEAQVRGQPLLLSRSVTGTTVS